MGVLSVAGQRASICGVGRGRVGARAGFRNPLAIAVGGLTDVPGLFPLRLLPFFSYRQQLCGRVADIPRRMSALPPSAGP